MRTDEELPDDEAPSPTQSARAFRREEMVACEKCGRVSPPTRLKCLYCGAALPAVEGGEELRRPALRPLEAWERGFNVVLVPRADAPGARRAPDALAEAASLVRVNTQQLASMVESGLALPVARTAEREEAALLERRLVALGLAVGIVSDEELAVEERPPRRVRGMRFDADGLVGGAQAGGEVSKVAWGDVVLLVTGRVFRKRIEVEERLKRGGGEAADSREFVEDAGVLDLYFAGGGANWRVAAEGFDYSCLGDSKSLLAAENFTRLAEALRARATNARYDDSYRRVRQWLQFAWPPDEQTESGALRRTGVARFSKDAVTVVSNEAQFTRYGRLLAHFAARGVSDNA